MAVSRTAVAEAAIERMDIWLQQHAPRFHGSLRPPASEPLLVAVQEEVGRSLPPEIRAWWSYADGVDFAIDEDLGRLIPSSFNPYSTAEALKRRRLMMDVARQLAPGDELARFLSSEDTRPAGTRCDTWLPSWLPIATDYGGSNLFVDLRAGSRSGCVMRYVRDGGASTEIEWADVAAMLYDVADRFIEGEAEIDSLGRILWR